MRTGCGRKQKENVGKMKTGGEIVPEYMGAH
jgi:hypothetical protein